VGGLAVYVGGWVMNNVIFSPHNFYNHSVKMQIFNVLSQTGKNSVQLSLPPY